MTRNRISTSAALSAEVGSSMIRMRASCATALAISTSCCWPMRRSSTGVSGSMSVSSRRRNSLARRSCSRWSMPSTPRVISREAKMFSATDRLPKRLSSWKTIPMPFRAASADERSTTGSPSRRMRPVVGCSTPAMIFIKRRLAGAVLADEHVHGAAADLEVRLLDRDGPRIDLRNALEAQHDVVNRGGHEAGPRVTVAGVTSGGSTALSSGKAPTMRHLPPDQRVAREGRTGRSCRRAG